MTVNNCWCGSNWIMNLILGDLQPPKPVIMYQFNCLTNVSLTKVQTKTYIRMSSSHYFYVLWFFFHFHQHICFQNRHVIYISWINPLPWLNWLKHWNLKPWQVLPSHMCTISIRTIWYQFVSIFYNKITSFNRWCNTTKVEITSYLNWNLIQWLNVE